MRIITDCTGHPTLSLRLDDNVVMFSANEVCRFLCGETGNEGFCGEDPTHQALVDYWLGWEASELKVYTCNIIIMIVNNIEIFTCKNTLYQKVCNISFGYLS